MYYRTPYTQRPTMQFGPRLTPAVKGLLIANTAVFFLQQIISVSSIAGLQRFLILFGLAPDMVLTRGFLWQPVTYMFLHGGVWHLGLNMLLLWMFGSELEALWGARPFLKYYFVCGVGAAVTTGVFDYHSRSIGASGAIFGLLLAYGLLFPRRVILLWFVVPIQARHLVWICAGIEFLSTINMQAAGDGIAHWAHLGGMLFGWIYLKRGLRLGDMWSRLKWKHRRSRFRVLDPDGDRRDGPDDGRDRWVH